MLKLLTTSFLVFGLVFTLPQASAENAPTTKKVTKKKVAKKKVFRKHSARKVESDAIEYDGDVPDTAGLSSKNYRCELGNRLTVFQKPKDDKQIALRWHERLYRLMRVNTTTGADRYENAKSGLTWVGIPTKGILLNSKNGKQLANECVDVVQLAKHST